MPANNRKWQVHYWQGKYGGLGHLYGPTESFSPFPHLPYALDNGAFAAWTNGLEWDRHQFLDHLDRAEFHAKAGHRAEWVVAPDVVTDAEATLEMWPYWHQKISQAGLLPALAVQDGMRPEELAQITPLPEVVFVGGSTEWKWLWVDRWCRSFDRVHIGRVNTYRWLIRAHQAGAESCDGTGFFRAGEERFQGLRRFLKEQSEGSLPTPGGLFGDSCLLELGENC